MSLLCGHQYCVACVTRLVSRKFGREKSRVVCSVCRSESIVQEIIHVAYSAQPDVKMSVTNEVAQPLCEQNGKLDSKNSAPHHDAPRLHPEDASERMDIDSE